MKQAKWIWYPGDFEIYHHMLLSFRRQEYGCDYPCVWPVSRPHVSVRFARTFTAERDGVIAAVTRGRGMVRFGGRLWPVNAEIPVPAGTHEISVELCDLNAFPSFFIGGDALITDEAWTAEPYDARPVPAACEPAYTSPDADPTVFPFRYAPLAPVAREEIPGGVLYDYGREQFGPVRVEIPRGAALLLTYGESRGEALDPAHAILTDRLTDRDAPDRPARAFRYIAVTGEGAERASLTAALEYLPAEDRASFTADEPGLNEIWALCARTFHLNTREFFLDGIKRDRWVWSGDAYQSFMIARYLYNDPAVTERTITALLGRPPYRRHVNTINDYSAYLLIALWEHIEATGRRRFLETVWENAKALYAFIVSRLDEETGFAVRRDGDWIFVDWGVLDKEDPICFEQIVLWKAHLSMARLAAVMGEETGSYTARAAALKARVFAGFWDEEKGAFIDSFASGKRFVSRQTNIFALLYDLVDGEKKRRVVKNGLLDPALPAVTTPYFKLYELSALCKIGEIEAAQDYISAYWGGMLKEGATAVWEAYDPSETGAAHYAMYGSPYGKSLCHAWGSGPILLLCRWVAGVIPGPAADKTFRVAPRPGRYKAFRATVPVFDGAVSLDYKAPAISVRATVPGGAFFDGETETALEPDRTYTFTLR